MGAGHIVEDKLGLGMRSVVCLLVCVAGLAGACEPKKEAHVSRVKAAAHESSANGGASAKPEHAGKSGRQHPPWWVAARWKSVEGDVRQGGDPVRPGQSLRVKQPIALGDDAKASLNISNGVRVELEGPLRARWGEVSPFELILGEGVAYVWVSEAPAAPVRVASVGGVYEFVGNGEVYFSASRSGAMWAAVKRGAGRFAKNDPSGSKPLPQEELSGDTAIRARLGEPSVERSTLKSDLTAGALRKRARRFRQGKATGLSDPEVQRILEAFLATITRVEQEGTRGRQLARDHRLAVRAEPERAKRLQGDLVRHSQQMYKGAQAVRARFAVLEAAWLLSGETAAGRAEFLRRVSELP